MASALVRLAALATKIRFLVDSPDRTISTLSSSLLFTIRANKHVRN